MTEITIRQNDDGAIELETPGEDGQPQVSPAESLDDAIAQVQAAMGGTEEPAPEEVPAEEPVEEEAQSLEEGLGARDKEKMGMRPKKAAGFEDYGL